MGTVRVVDGKVLTVDGKAATDESCCCGPVSACGSLPPGKCIHALCFEARIDQSEFDAATSFGDLVDIIALTGDLAGVVVGGIFPDYTGFSTGGIPAFAAYTSAATGTVAYIPFSSLEGTADVWHQFNLEIRNYPCLQLRLTIDGIPTGWGQADFNSDIATTYDGFVAGAKYAGAGSHRSLRNINLVGNANAEENSYSFVPGSFDSFAGGSSIDDEGNLRIDDDSGSAYAQKTLSPAYQFGCCGVGGEVYRITISGSASGAFTYTPNMFCNDGNDVSVPINVSAPPRTTDTLCPNNFQTEEIFFSNPCPVGTNCPSDFAAAFQVAMGVQTPIGGCPRTIEVIWTLLTACDAPGGSASLDIGPGDPTGTYVMIASSGGVNFSATVVIAI